MCEDTHTHRARFPGTREFARIHIRTKDLLLKWLSEDVLGFVGLDKVDGQVRGLEAQYA